MNVPLFIRYYLRMPHNVGTSLATEAVETYIKVHSIIRELPYKMWIQPTQIDNNFPARTSNHYIMFVTIMTSREEAFNKVLFELALKYGVETREKVVTYSLTENQDGET